MKLLALDTATEACSVALLIDGASLTRYSEPKRGHSELILPMVDEVLTEAGVKLIDLDAIAVGRGPGAFTGIRIAIGVAQGLAFGADVPVVLISDLAALAQRSADTHGARAVLACIDARMNEVYWGAFAKGPDGLVSPLIEESVSPPGAVAMPGPVDWIGAGSGWGAYPAMAGVQPADGRVIDATTLPRAAEIARLAERDFRHGKAVPAEQAQPVYLRDRVAWASGKP